MSDVIIPLDLNYYLRNDVSGIENSENQNDYYYSNVRGIVPIEVFTWFLWLSSMFLSCSLGLIVKPRLILSKLFKTLPGLCTARSHRKKILNLNLKI